jgi:hypothetical protein
MDRKLGGLIAAALALAGCATTKEWLATGGSKSDAMVEFSYSYNGFQKPQADRSQADRMAKDRCAAWGYPTAEAFGPPVQQCTSSNAYGCTGWTVTARYQCTGSSSQ